MSMAQNAVMQILRVDHVSAEVLGALSRRGVDAILLKGPALEAWTPAEHRPRTYVDTDVLVAPARVVETREVLAGLGFEPLLREGEATGRDKAMHWIRPGDGANVDLHFTIAGLGVPPDRAWAVLSGRTEPFRVGGADVRVLDAAARALHVGLHAAQHGAGVSQPLRDLSGALALAPASCWPAAAELAHELGAAGPFEAGLRLDAEGARLADELALGGTLGVEEMLRVESGPPLTLGLHTFSDQSWLERLRTLWRELAPSPTFMRLWSGLARRGPLGLALAYLWRPFWLVLNLPRAVVALRRARRLTR